MVRPYAVYVDVKSALSYDEICTVCDVNPADAVVAASSSITRVFYFFDRVEGVLVLRQLN